MIVTFIGHGPGYHSVCFYFVTHDVTGDLQHNEPDTTLNARVEWLAQDNQLVWSIQ